MLQHLVADLDSGIPLAQVEEGMQEARRRLASAISDYDPGTPQ